MFINCENLSVVDYLRSGALVVAFIAVFVADRKRRGECSVWWKADVIQLGALGAAFYLFPKILLEYVSTAKVDIIHEEACREIGALMLGFALAWRHFSNERGTLTAWLLFRTLTLATVVMIQIHAHTQFAGQAVHMKDQNVSFSMLASVLLLLGNLIHLVQRGSFGSVRRAWTTQDPMTVHLLIDILFLLPMGIAALMFPEWAGKFINLKDFKMDNVHMTLYRMFGLVVLMTRVFHIMALNFTEERDRKAVFAGYLWAVVLATPWGIFYQVKYDFMSCPALWYMLAYTAVPILNALIACGCLPSPAQLFKKKRA